MPEAYLNEKMRISVQQRRRRQIRQGMTLIEIMIVMVIMALVATAASFAIIPAMNKARVKQASTDAKLIASAADLYIAEEGGCPTVDELVSSKILNKRTNTLDSWGNDFNIECDEDGAMVSSAGPDEQMGTDDDIE